MTRRVLSLAVVAVGAMLLSAHVGTNVEYQVGRAGAYPVQVVVRLPGVIPGQAQVSVQVDADDVSGVSVQPLFWRAVEHAPTPERAHLVPGETRLWTTDVWLMAVGSYGVRVVVDGARGPGELIVPITAVATRTLEMQRTLAMVLAGLGLFLVVGLLTIVRAAALDGLVPPGQEPDARRRRRSWIATVIAAVVVATALVGGSAWWRSVDADYRARVDRPVPVATEVAGEGDGRVLRLEITQPSFLQGTPLIPDHGKLMHLFLVREPELDVFAHLHPERADSLLFLAHLPPIPAGRYRLYAGVVRASGAVRTLQDSLDIPAPLRDEARWLHDDPDASWSDGAPSAETVALADGSLMTLEPGVPTAGEPSMLRVRVRTADGAAASLEPYLGMFGHAVVTRADGALFVHLHPDGTVSMAAMRQYERRSRGDTALVAASPPAGEHAGHLHHPSGDLAFPFVFPADGRHRVWIQVRRAGRNLTGAFDVEVR